MLSGDRKPDTRAIEFAFEIDQLSVADRQELYGLLLAKRRQTLIDRMSDEEPDKKYEGLKSVATAYGVASVLTFIAGILAILASLMVPTFASVIEPLPTNIVSGALIILGPGLLLTSWRLGISRENVQWKIDLADYARRTAEAVEALAATVKKH